MQSSTAGVNPSSFAGPAHLYIGLNSDPSYAAYYKGSVDEIRIYNRALSTAEIAELP